MRRFGWMLAIAAAAGCQQAPVTRPRILSVQTPAGMPPAPSLKSTRTNPLIVPTAPVGTALGVQQAVAVPTYQPPLGAVGPTQVIPVPATPTVQGIAPPNTIGNPNTFGSGT